MQDDDLNEEAREYCVLASMISRGKLGGPLPIEDVLEDARGYCSIPEFHFCPNFRDEKDLIAKIHKKEDYLSLSGDKYVSLKDESDARLIAFYFQQPIEEKKHFNLVFDTAKYLGTYFSAHALGSPLLLITNKFVTGKLFPIEGKVSIEPDITMALRDRRSQSIFGFRERVAVEVQRSNPDNLYGKLRRYADLEQTQKASERMFLLIVIPYDLSYAMSEFKERALEMSWTEEIDYRIVVADGERFEGLPEIKSGS